MSVSPIEAESYADSEIPQGQGPEELDQGGLDDEDADDEDLIDDPGVDEYLAGVRAQRIRLEPEDDFIRKLADPTKPNPEEIEAHEMRGHVEYRNWCPHCVKTRGRSLPHKSLQGKERKIPEYSFDYTFPGDEFGYKWTVLAGREKVSKSWMATAVPKKGFVEGRFDVEKMLEFISENGDSENEIIVKCDQESAIEFVLGELVKARPKGKSYRILA